MTIEVVRRIDQIGRDEWDDLSRSRRFADHRWLQLAESILVAHEPRYVLLREAGRLEAAAVCSIGRRFGHRSLQRRAGWVLRPFPWLRCTVPLSSEPGLLMRSDADAARHMPTMLAAIRRLAQRERALFLTYGHCSPNDSTWSALQQAGFRPLSRWTDGVLPITWSSTAEYLAALPGPDRREIGRLQRRADRESIAVEHLQPPLEHASRLRQLVAGVSEHHGTRDLYVPDLLSRTAAICGRDLHVLAACQAGEIIGCAIMLRSGDELLGKWIGLDYARTWGTATYQLLIFESIRLAIALGVRRLGLGATAFQTKRGFGAVAEERLSALSVTGPVPAWLASAAAGFISGRAAFDPNYSSAAGRTTVSA